MPRDIAFGRSEEQRTPPDEIEIGIAIDPDPYSTSIR